MHSPGIRTFVTAAAILMTAPAFAQRLAFEVADLKPSDPASPEHQKGRMLPGGRIEAPSVTLKSLIALAYGVEENRISGGPKWADTARYDLVAKAPEKADLSAIREMVQTLLTDRFHLVFHREEKSSSAYVLTLGKRAPKYRETAGAQQTCSWEAAGEGLRKRACQNMTMAEFARQLPGWGGIGINLPVADETGLKGRYDFELVVGMPGKGEGNAGVSEGPTIFAALEQIGLKLDSRRMPMPTIVIDSAEPPTQN
jgi:uncharacterized protein (TIGR03435 family)